jgi:hypothetical protein
MRSPKTNVSAILAGEQRSARFKFRHSVSGAAKEVGIPTSWVWYWLLVKRTKSRTWLRKVWVRLEDVQKLFADAETITEAFYATDEPLTSPEAIRQLVERWPDEYHPCVKFQPPRKKASQSAKAQVVSLPVANPVFGEDQKSEVVA